MHGQVTGLEYSVHTAVFPLLIRCSVLPRVSQTYLVSLTWRLYIIQLRAKNACPPSIGDRLLVTSLSPAKACPSQRTTSAFAQGGNSSSATIRPGSFRLSWPKSQFLGSHRTIGSPTATRLPTPSPSGMTQLLGAAVAETWRQVGPEAKARPGTPLEVNPLGARGWRRWGAALRRCGRKARRPFPWPAQIRARP